MGLAAFFLCMTSVKNWRCNKACSTKEEQPACLITPPVLIQILCSHLDRGWKQRYPLQIWHWCHWETCGHQDRRLAVLISLKYKRQDSGFSCFKIRWKTITMAKSHEYSQVSTDMIKGSRISHNSVDLRLLKSFHFLFWF